MKTTLILTLLLICIYGKSQAPRPTFRGEIFSKSNIVHIGKRGYIEKDKFLHSTIGAWVGSSVYMYVHYKTDNKMLSIALSVLSAFVVGEAKELYDRSKGGKFSNENLAYTTFGGFSGAFTKIVQIDMQEKNKELTRQYKEEFENLNVPSPKYQE